MNKVRLLIVTLLLMASVVSLTSIPLVYSGEGGGGANTEYITVTGITDVTVYTVVDHVTVWSITVIPYTPSVYTAPGAGTTKTPGFPVESILLGLMLGGLVLVLLRRRTMRGS